MYASVSPGEEAEAGAAAGQVAAHAEAEIAASAAHPAAERTGEGTHLPPGGRHVVPAARLGVDIRLCQRRRRQRHVFAGAAVPHKRGRRRTSQQRGHRLRAARTRRRTPVHQDTRPPRTPFGRLPCGLPPPTRRLNARQGGRRNGERQQPAPVRTANVDGEPSGCQSQPRVPSRLLAAGACRTVSRRQLVEHSISGTPPAAVRNFGLASAAAVGDVE